ncbi:MAG: hypothetical protein AVDCRST_MAG89-3783 [uncultured Gemmatimonadetes bacterium]|uniref:Uncharacterized protein n=1 Tax=uncultured Gemmatimonadota bacterium TaxID=203437 RepID=A0A6J4MMS2_9BACT|nr:MAG: hypothetical protein AVDCRST_MAG89-3783 [uncultured Gemmatimonadota bacterium]
MSSLAWVAAGVVAAAVAWVLLRALFSARPRGGPDQHRPPTTQTWTQMGGVTVRVRLAEEDRELIRTEIGGLHVIRKDLNRIGDLLERLLEEAIAVDPVRVNPPRPAGGAARVMAVDPGRRTAPEPVHGAPVRRIELDSGPRVEHAGAFDPNPLPPAASDAPGAAPRREPSPDAASVEASHDIVVSSNRHPPEAWMERGEVWLNARVTLTDPALQRWSTFFDWERREPGARYETTRPAVVAASGGVVRKGLARPL